MPVSQPSGFVSRRSARRRTAACLLTAFFASAGVTSTIDAAAQGNFVNFESGQVRPLALSLDGTQLFAVNTPDNRLTRFAVTDSGLVHLDDVAVGLEPVAVAARSDDEVWVVNHLSDSISIVDYSAPHGHPRVVRTLLVGDEPRDILFAGAQGERAFVTTAHRGQHSPFPFAPSANEGRADIWVFDARAPAQPLTVLQLFGDTPRALAASPDRRTVFAAVFASGNRTSVLSAETIDGRIGNPRTNADGIPAPIDVGLIVQQQDDGRWLDAQGRDWSGQVQLQLPDYDVFVIDAAAAVPAEIDRISGVGTTLFNMRVTPDGRHLLVSNLQARNQVRFEGRGAFAPGSVRGHFIENRISVVDLEDGNRVAPRHLNRHINYEREFGTPAEREASLATPLEIAVTADGATAYVAAFGSGRLGVFAVGDLVDDTFVPSPDAQIPLSGGGPSGVVLDEAHGRAYVLTRFDNAVKVVDLARGEETASHALYSPEPPAIVAGRRFLYDARLTSSRGDSSCAGCHVFGDTDQLAWDVGNPDAPVQQNFNPFVGSPPPAARDFHPVKGAMFTQSLRGIADSGAMHWRGDRSGATAPGAGDHLDAEAALRAFNVTFDDLLAREQPLSDSQMDLFAAFALSITYPPNPIRALDNSLTPFQQAGREAYFTVPSVRALTCADCHTLDPANRLFGTSVLSTTEQMENGRFRQPMKVPHLRNIYTKVGFIAESLEPDPERPPAEAGANVRGFGFRHDGSDGSLERFVSDFTLESEEQVLQVQDFIVAFDTNLAPVVGQQVTLTPGGLGTGIDQLLLLWARAAVVSPAAECDLIAKGVWDGAPRGALRSADGRFRQDRAGDGALSLRDLIVRSQQPGNAITLTCVPPGAGYRMGIDRDSDGVLDGDEPT